MEAQNPPRGRRRHLQAICVQKLPVQARELRTAVRGIAGERMAGRGEVDANLVRPAGVEGCLYQVKAGE
jgi:hypothetical protein